MYQLINICHIETTTTNIDMYGISESYPAIWLHLQGREGSKYLWHSTVMVSSNQSLGHQQVIEWIRLPHSRTPTMVS